MKRLLLLFFLSLIIIPQVAFAAERKVIFSAETLADPSAIQWQISNNKDDSLYQKKEGFLLKSDGDAYLVYSMEFSYNDFDELVITLYSDQELEITVLADVSKEGLNTFEFKQVAKPSEEFKEYHFSLRHPFFKQVNDFGINFYSNGPSNIVLKEISLNKMGMAGFISQIFKDYFRIASYSPFTVNVFPTPRIFGHAAFMYFLPIFLILVWLLAFSPKYRTKAIIGLLILWIITDQRMGYEFARYQLYDYQTWVRPPVQEKMFRNYDDFYVFVDWLKKNLPSEKTAVNYYFFGPVQFPRILQYYLYPVEVYNQESKADTFVVLHRDDIKYNPADSRLYHGGKPISRVGDLKASYSDNSFIFIEK